MALLLIRLPIPCVLMESIYRFDGSCHCDHRLLSGTSIANDDSSLGNTVGNNATVNLLVNDQLADGSQATTTNTSVELIDPATGMPTVTPNVVTISGQGVYTYNPSTGDLTFDPFLMVYHGSYSNQLYPYWNIDRIDRRCCSDNDLYWRATGCQWRQLTGQYSRYQCNRKPAYQRPIVGWKSGYYHQYFNCIDWSCYGYANGYTKCSCHSGTKVSILIILLQAIWPSIRLMAAPRILVRLIILLPKIRQALSDNATVTITYIETHHLPWMISATEMFPAPMPLLIYPATMTFQMAAQQQHPILPWCWLILIPVCQLLRPIMTIPGQGTYTYNPATGDLTFDPVDGFTTDPDPIDYILTEVMTGLTDQATVTITYDEVPPIANDDTSSGKYNWQQCGLKHSDNDQLSDGSPATVANTGVVFNRPFYRHANIDAKCYQYTRVGIYTWILQLVF